MAEVSGSVEPVLQVIKTLRLKQHWINERCLLMMKETRCTDGFEVITMLTQLERRITAHLPRKINALLPKAAVLIPVTDHAEPTLILTRRASHMSTHSGEVAFPGGKQDLTDRNLIETALRESEEEIGLDRGKVRVLGETGTIISRYGLEVTPVVGIVDKKANLTANTEELDRIFQVPLHFFLNRNNLTIDHWQMQSQNYQMPCYWYGEYRIWGLTALILAEFLNITLDADIPLDAPQMSPDFALIQKQLMK